MPRKQRFKPSRKPKPMTEESQRPVSDRISARKEESGLAPGPRERERDDAPQEHGYLPDSEAVASKR